MSPALEVDLPPFGATIQLHVETFDFVLVILGLDFILRNVNDRVVLFDLHQHLFAVERDLVIVGIAKHRLLAVIEIVSAEMRFFVFLLE